MNIGRVTKLSDKPTEQVSKQDWMKFKKMLVKLIKEFNPSGAIVSNRGIYSAADRPLVDQIWQAHGLTNRDNVRIFVVPPNSRIRPGSFIHRPTENAATRRLSLKITRLQRQLQENETGISQQSRFDEAEVNERENARERHNLKREIEEHRRSLRRARRRLADAPRSGFIVAHSKPQAD